MTATGGTRRRDPDFVVLALGNAIRSDDGAGVHALEAMRQTARLPSGVRLVDGGTAAAGLLPQVAGCDGLMILDAVDAGGRPGDVVRLDLVAGVGGGPQSPTAHELGLRELLGDLRLLGAFPGHAVLFGIQPASLAPGTRLSPPVARALGTLVGAALGELAEWAQMLD